MKKQKLLSVITALSICLTLASCGSSDESSDSYSPSGGAAGDAKSAEETIQDEQIAPAEEGMYADNEINGMPAATYAETAEMVTEAAVAETVTENGYFPPDYPSYFPNAEEYAKITENGFLAVADNPLSTFSADVDTASYTNIRRMLNNGYLPTPDAVRIEEILNYFDYDYKYPDNGEPFGVTTELSDCPWNPQSKLLLCGIRAKETEKTDIPNNLVFLIDVSGSMFQSDKLPLVQQAFSMLTDNLDESDRISIVTYAGEDKVVLEGESGDNKKEIISAIDSLSAGGSTAGAAGIKTAYEIAEKYFIENGNNRVILATDGDLNVGASSVEDLTALIEKKRESGIFLSVLGFGEGNYKDNRLEAIADNGNGNYSYIDSITEAQKVLVEEMDSTLFTVAKDVKFQIEFNPANVVGYRLIGYDNRALADRDFNDDTKDAGEVGAGSTVTVLYELITAEDASKYAPDYKYAANAEKAEEEQVKTDRYSDELLTVNIRCKAPDSDESKLYIYPVKKSLYTEKMPENLNFAASCAEFGMILRNSENKGSSSWESISELLGNYDYKGDKYKTEFGYLVRMAANIYNSEFYGYNYND